MKKQVFFLSTLAFVFPLSMSAFQANVDLKKHQQVPFCDKLKDGIDSCVIEGTIKDVLAYNQWIFVDYQTKLSKEGQQLITKNCKLYGSFVINTRKQAGLALLATMAVAQGAPVVATLDCTAQALKYHKKYPHLGFKGPLATSIGVASLK